ncbi:IclR family transcriptional regulator [Paenibacillus sp. GCM10012307]|uniref:IclR family transcriptional regulator n=1 Tax=Paenibacillus roseus TaxID=2798579 RepID=A0A934JAY9_9BACL|nr:IclR family transcriptional regulator [Paenibacillus roseus]MBJ6363846.1 IclR family transcriptional regulator [Paenibacillus roseus]
MEKKYWVPALEKATRILELVAENPHQLKLIDLSRRLDINKSSMFSLLNTMEELRWISKDKGDTYAISSFFGLIGSGYFRQYDLISLFRQEAFRTKSAIGETIQLAKLEGSDVLYLAKEEASSPVRLASDPGMRLPAHSTALGKVMLAFFDDSEIHRLYPQETLSQATTNSISTKESLLQQFRQIRESGMAYDLQEAVIGFSCVAAPIMGTSGEVIAAVSCSMPQHQWEVKQEQASREIQSLAQQLSQCAQPQTIAISK